MTGAAYVLEYNRASGEVYIERITKSPSGISVSTPYHSTWTKGWTIFSPFALGDPPVPHYIGYKYDTGEVTLDRLLAGGTGVKTLYKTTLPTLFTAIVPLTLDGAVYLLKYSDTGTDMFIDRVLPGGLGLEKVHHESGWQKGVELDRSLHRQHESAVLSRPHEGPQAWRRNDRASAHARCRCRNTWLPQVVAGGDGPRPAGASRRARTASAALLSRKRSQAAIDILHTAR